MAGDRLLRTEYQLTQRSDNVSALVAARDGRHRLSRSLAEDSQVDLSCLLLGSDIQWRGSSAPPKFWTVEKVFGKFFGRIIFFHLGLENPHCRET